MIFRPRFFFAFLIQLFLFFSFSAFGQIESLRPAVDLFNRKQYLEAARLFEQLTHQKLNPEDRLKVKSYLGASLIRLKLYQSAAYLFIEASAAKNPNLQRLAIDYLVLIGDKVNDSTLLRYTLARAKPELLSPKARGIYQSRIAEKYVEDNQLDQAITYYLAALRQLPNSEWLNYSIGTLYLKKNSPEMAIPYFETALRKIAKDSPTSTKRASAILGVARAHYQNKNWKEAARYFRMVSKDNPTYAETQFELSWALFRDGQLRSALSPLQSLHTPFYQNYYAPESLLLRGVILLFICKFDEIDVISKIYDSTYRQAQRQLINFLQSNANEAAGFQLINQAYKNLILVKKQSPIENSSSIPFFITRSLLLKPDIKRNIEYLVLLNREAALSSKLFRGPQYKDLLHYSQKVIASRSNKTKSKIGAMALKHLESKLIELTEISNQMDFLRYEMLDTKRTQMKKAHLGEQKSETEKALFTRNYYIQNGYRFWPFDGEYWRDEIGNYQYVGVNSCE